MKIIIFFLIIVNFIWDDIYYGLNVITVRETFILPEKYLLVSMLNIILVYLFTGRMKSWVYAHVLCRIRSRSGYAFLLIVVCSMCSVFLWIISASSDMRGLLIRFIWIWLTCNIQVIIQILISNNVALIIMIVETVLSMFLEHHILWGDIGMVCRSGNASIPIVVFTIITFLGWIPAVKKIKQMDVVNYDN